MNVDTGELMKAELLSLFSVAIQKQFKSVPDELAEAAEAELAGKEQTVVDMTKETPLVQWAKSQQHHANPNNRKAMQKASKKRNRGR